MSSAVYDKIIGRICELHTRGSTKGPKALFEEVCLALDVEIASFYYENVSNVGLYVCQIILNKEIFIDTASGNTCKMAYKNSVTEFFNLCLTKGNIGPLYTLNDPDSFYKELSESFDNITLSISLRNTLDQFCHDHLSSAYISKINSVNYGAMKKELVETNSPLTLSETYRIMDDGEYMCTIFVNGISILHQGHGQNMEVALENTVTEFFEANEIATHEDMDDTSTFNNKEQVELQLSLLFNQKKGEQIDQHNYWDIIQKCIKELNYHMIVECGALKINGIIMVDCNETNEYVANLVLCRKFVAILSGVKQQKLSSSIGSPNPSTPSIMNFQKIIKAYNDEEREEKMKEMVTEAHIKYLAESGKTYWHVLNREFVRENCKVEPRYEDKGKEKICTLIFQGWEVISGSGIDKSTSREAVSMNLVDKYLSPN